MRRLKWLFDNQVVLRVIIGTVALLFLFLVVWLWNIFPLFFTSMACLAATYVFGSAIWGIIES